VEATAMEQRNESDRIASDQVAQLNKGASSNTQVDPAATPAPALSGTIDTPGVASQSDLEARLRQVEITQAEWKGSLSTFKMMIVIILAALAWFGFQTWQDFNKKLEQMLDKAQTHIEQVKTETLASMENSRKEVADRKKNIQEAWAKLGPDPMAMQPGTKAAVEKAAESLRGKENKTAEEHSILGVEAYNKGDRTQAEAEWRRVIELNPKLAPVHAILGVLLNETGRKAEAEASYRRAIELDPKLAPAYINLGLLLADTGRIAEAEATFRRAIEMNPKDAMGYTFLGVLLDQTGRKEEAETALRRAIELDPKLAQAHSNLGILLRETGRIAEAETVYRRAIELDPKLAAAHFNIACLFAQTNRKTDALVSLKRAIDLDVKFREKAKTDKDLDPIRDDPEFKKLIEP
jgi:Flp pilus assembly protein TadD